MDEDGTTSKPLWQEQVASTGNYTYGPKACTFTPRPSWADQVDSERPERSDGRSGGELNGDQDGVKADLPGFQWKQTCL